MTEAAHDGPASPALGIALSPLALHTQRGLGALVGRPSELTAIGQELSSAKAGHLVGLTLEGEPGIGKTRLLLEAGELASTQGFTTISVTGDEELRAVPRRTLDRGIARGRGRREGDASRGRARPGDGRDDRT